MALERIDLIIHVAPTNFLGEPARVGVTITLPSPETMPPRPVVCFAKPAGAYSRGYFTHELRGPGSDAQADWHARKGWIFVSMDALGTGDSSRHDPDKLTLAALSEAAFLAEQEILIRLANGHVSAGFPPVIQLLKLGIGHSLGGCVAIMQQAHHACYDGLAVLGYGVFHNVPASPPGCPPLVVPWGSRDIPLGKPGGIVNLAAYQRGKDTQSDRATWQALRWSTYFDDVPDEMVNVDLSHYVPRETFSEGSQESRLPWAATGNAGRAVRAVLTPGVVAPEAAAIAIPVLIAAGERDFVAHPADETRAYRSAISIDLFICPKMGHAHNMAGTRAFLWERIHDFGNWCAIFAAATEG